MVHIKHITFRQLQVFESIAQNGSFTSAAEELFLTQPTVSMQIKKLTDAVGAPLFEQIGKKIYLTDVGKELLSASRDISGAFARFEMAMDNMQGIKQGDLRLTAVTTTEYFTPRILGGFSQRYPGINLFFRVTNRQALLSHVRENSDDLYIVGQPPDDLGLEITPFVDNPLVLVAPPNHPLVGKMDLTLTDIAEENFLIREPGTGTRLALDKLLRAHNNASLNIVMELGSNEAIKQGVMGGLGLSVLSRYAISSEVENGALAVLDVQGFPLQHQWCVVYPAQKKLSVVARAFLDYLLTEGRDVAQSYLTGHYCPIRKDQFIEK